MIVIGSVNLYSTLPDEVSPDPLALAGLYATQAPVALGHAQERAQLTEALETSKVLGQAVGVLMERYDMNAERAFVFLVRASSHTNIELRDVAQELVDQRRG